MTQVVRGDTGAADDVSYADLLEDQAEQFGADDLDPEEVLGEIDTEDEDADGEAPNRARRSGTDEIVNRLESLDPSGEAADLVRGMQRKMSQNINEWNDLRTEVLDIREEMLRQREDNDVAEDVEEDSPLPEGITDDHLDAFRSMAEHLGYVPKAEIDQTLHQRDTEVAADTSTQAALLQGVEEFGDAFGTVDNAGNVELNPEIRGPLSGVLARITSDTSGITPYDLFKIAYPSAPTVDQQEVRAPQVSRRRGSTRTPQVNVARRSTGGRTGVSIRSATPQNDDADSVFDRAWAKARVELTR